MSRFILLFDTPAQALAFGDLCVADAAEMLILATKGERPLMFSDTAMRKALHADRPPPTPQRRRTSARKFQIV